MSGFDSQRQESLKRRWLQEKKFDNVNPNKTSTLLPFAPTSNPKSLYPTLSGGGGGFDDDLVASVVPPVTVVLEGRSICQRISLHKHESYESLARALRHMFVDLATADHHQNIPSSSSSSNSDRNNYNSDGDDAGNNLDLSNAVPGHLIAYEDMENDLLLVGDLNWKDFVRVAKRIRILPAKAKTRKYQGLK